MTKRVYIECTPEELFGVMIAMKELNDKETTDEIIRETRRIKEVLAKSMDFDIDRILKDARLRQRKSGRKILSPSVQQLVD